jgi:hypothetical protein
MTFIFVESNNNSRSIVARKCEFFLLTMWFGTSTILSKIQFCVQLPNVILLVVIETEIACTTRESAEK